MTNDLSSTTLNIKNFGPNLKRIRIEKGMTRIQLAYAIGLENQRIIYDYEDGFKFPRIEKLVAIANALGVSLDGMFR